MFFEIDILSYIDEIIFAGSCSTEMILQGISRLESKLDQVNTEIRKNRPPPFCSPFRKREGKTEPLSDEDQ